MKLEKNIFYVLISEMLFTILPLIIVLIVRGYENKFEQLFYNTEWAMMAIILFGQSIVKLSSGISHSSLKFQWQFVSLTVTMLIVLGLIPSCTILIINLLSSENSFTLYLLQLIWFLLGATTFFVVGYLGQKFLDEK